MATSILVSIDYENNAEEWWDAMRTALPALAQTDAELCAILKTLDQGNVGIDGIEITDASTIQRFCDFCESLPGWSDGPSHAKTALLISQQ